MPQLLRDTRALLAPAWKEIWSVSDDGGRPEC